MNNLFGGRKYMYLANSWKMHFLRSSWTPGTGVGTLHIEQDFPLPSSWGQTWHIVNCIVRDVEDTQGSMKPDSGEGWTRLAVREHIAEEGKFKPNSEDEWEMTRWRAWGHFPKWGSSQWERPRSRTEGPHGPGGVGPGAWPRGSRGGGCQSMHFLFVTVRICALSYKQALKH